MISPPTAIYHLLSRLRASTYYTFKGFCSSEPVDVLVVGNDMPYRFYSRLLGNNSFPKLRKVRNHAIDKLVSSTGADVVIFHLPDHLIPASLETVALPEHVNVELPLAGTYARYLKSLKKSALADLAKAKKAGFRFSISNSPADLQDFYSNLYVPTMTSKYREDAYIYPIEYLRNFLRHGYLLTVSAGDGPFLAANLIRKGKNHLWTKFGGIRGGSDKIRRMGVNPALILEIIRRGYQDNCTHIDFGISLPFRTDSAFFFKDKWGAETHLPPFRTTTVNLAFNNKKSKELFWKQTKPITYDDVAPSLSSKVDK